MSDLITIPAASFREGRWRNGMGVSWDIASDPPDAGLDDFGWRFALARIEADVPFSGYDEVERIITLIEGNGFDLDVTHVGRLAIHDRCVPWRFSGDQASRANLIDGPCRVLNLFLRHGRWRGDAAIASGFQNLNVGACDVALLFALQGDCLSGDTHLAQGDAAIAGPDLTLEAASPDCLLYIARLARA